MTPNEAMRMMRDPDGARPQRQFIRPVAIGAGAVVLLGAAVLFAPYFTVHQNERTVVTTWGKVSYEAGPGIHLRVPIMQDMIPIPVDVRSVRLDKLNTYTVDSQELVATIVFQYRIPVDRVLDVYTNLGTAYEARLESMVVDRFKTVIGTVNAIDLASQRGPVTKRVLESVRSAAAQLYDGIDITDFQFVNFDWNDAYRQAISNASVAKARVDQQEQEKRQAEVQAQQAVVQATGAANASIASATGAAQAIKLKADADAYATRVAGEAQAAALTAQATALGQNQTLVSMTWAQHWNGVLPTSTYGSAPLPMVMGK